MDNEKFVNILIEEIYNDQIKSNLTLYNVTSIERTGGIIFESKKLFNKFNETEKKLFLDIITSNVEDTIAIMLAKIDQWGGGYFDDGENNDGHFELYYVSDEEGKYKYRVDEGASDLFLEKIEYLHEEENLGAGTKS